MPPMNVKKGDGPQAIRKDVDFVAKDADEQVATGIVMVPDKVDLQGDFVREDQIRAFADQFENFEEVGEAGGGIMHAVFPDEWLDLERNEVLDETEEIGGQTAPAGSWIQSWKYNHDDLWQLVEDGTFAGFSVGIDAVRWDGPYEQADVDDVEVPEEIDEDELVWQIVEGIMREVSTVDIPAVPDAMILDKAELQKRLGDHLGNRDAFIEEAVERGHPEDTAEEMWQVLNEAAEIEGAGEPGKESMFAKAGKAFLSALTGGDGDRAGVAETPDADPRKSTDDDPDEDEDEDEPDDDDDPDGDTSDDSTDMSNDTDDGGDKSLAEQNAEQIGELTAAVETLTETIAGPQPKTAEIEIDGETYEVPEDAAKAALGVDEDAGVGVAEAIDSLKNQVEEQQQRLDLMNQQSGVSTQLENAAGEGGEGDDEDGLGGLGKALS